MKLKIIFIFPLIFFALTIPFVSADFWDWITGRAADTNSSQASIEIISPKAGEVLETGRTYTILYNQKNMPPDAWIGIARLYQGANFLIDITPSFSKQPLTGSLQWTIGAGSVTGNDFKIHIVANTGTVGSESNIAEAWSAPFKITAANQQIIAPCSDSDNGINYYVKGVGKGLYQGGGPHYIFGTEPDPAFGKPTTDEFTTFYDHCATAYQINEAYCTDGKLMSVGYFCQNGCKDGTCLQAPSSSVKEQTKCIFQGSSKAQKCSLTVKSQGQSYDYGCTGISECSFAAEAPLGVEVVIYSGCSGENYVLFDGKDGSYYFKCESQQCEDSDGGTDYYTKGTTSNSKGVVTYDACTNNELTEFYCAPDGEIYPNNYMCPNSCKDGACVKTAASCIDSDGGKNYYTKGTFSYKGADGFSIGPAEDSCIGSEVAEWYCKDSGGYEQIRFLCPNVCKDGACLRPTCGNGICEVGEEDCPEDCSKKEICSDGTAYGKCSNSQPLFCDNGRLWNKCSVCGCMTGETCHPDGSCRSSSEDNIDEKPKPEPAECHYGCLDTNDNCLPMGTRTFTQYCNIDKTLMNQLPADAPCNNNYECETNFCLEGRCTERGFFMKVMVWFKKLFG